RCDSATEGFADTPLPLVTEIPVPPLTVRFAHAFVPERTAIPEPDSPSRAAKSSARAKVRVPVVVVGEPEIVNPAAGAVAATEVTEPEPPPPIEACDTLPIFLVVAFHVRTSSVPPSPGVEKIARLETAVRYWSEEPVRLIPLPAMMAE